MHCPLGRPSMHRQEPAHHIQGNALLHRVRAPRAPRATELPCVSRFISGFRISVAVSCFHILLGKCDHLPNGLYFTFRLLMNCWIRTTQWTVWWRRVRPPL